MKWIEAVRKFSDQLAEPYELEFVWRNQHDLSKLDWLNLMQQDILANDEQELAKISGRLERHEPPQYIVGWEDFFGLRFKVDRRVLIPRPETEELVQLILAENRDTNLRVLDIGTGSGAIAISLVAQRSAWEITASDISEEALNLAEENGRLNQVTIKFVKSDVLDNISGKFDLIVSNPPYISPAELTEVDESVKRYEPENALFAADDGLAIYKKLAQQAHAHLTENGKIYLEIGYKQGQTVKDLFAREFPDKKVSLHKDFAGKDRMVSLV